MIYNKVRIQHSLLQLENKYPNKYPLPISVVEIIAVTGMYEITDATKTFDFDLCDLPPETLKNLTTLLNRFST